MEIAPNLSTKKSATRRIKVVALAYNGLCTFEYGIVAEVFGLPRPEFGPNWYDFQTVAIEKGKLKASGGLEFTAGGSRVALREAQTLIIPGWRGYETSVPEEICEIVRRAHDRGVRLVSICSGIYVLAAAGLLTNRSATTHWRYIEDFSQRFPDVNLKPNNLYVEDGNILTSAGSSAGIDLCLQIVRTDYGTKIANSVARRLVMHAHRQGGQSQYIEHPVPKQAEADRLSSTIEYLLSNLDSHHSLASLAKSSGMSHRSFQRKFRGLTGLPVFQWLTNQRLSEATKLLESTTASMEEISDSVGMTNAENLRFHFRNKFGLSPHQYRKRFSMQENIN